LEKDRVLDIYVVLHPLLSLNPSSNKLYIPSYLTNGSLAELVFVSIFESPFCLTNVAFPTESSLDNPFPTESSLDNPFPESYFDDSLLGYY